MKALTFKTSSLLLTMGILSACGSGGSSGPQIETGVFIDSAVGGLKYQTATQSGLTNSSGEFKYIAGENVTFSNR